MCKVIFFLIFNASVSRSYSFHLVVGIIIIKLLLFQYIKNQNASSTTDSFKFPKSFFSTFAVNWPGDFLKILFGEPLGTPTGFSFSKFFKELIKNPFKSLFDFGFGLGLKFDFLFSASGDLLIFVTLLV